MDLAQRKDKNNVCNKKAPKKRRREKKEEERNERKRWDFQGVLTDLHFIIERLDY